MTHYPDITDVSRKRAAVITVLTHYSTTVFLMVQGIVLVPLYIRFMGETVYGGWLATGSIVGYLALLDMGLGSIISRQAADCAGRGDRRGLAAVTAAGLVVTVVPAVLVAVLGWLLSGFVAEWVGLPEQAALLGRAFRLAALAAAAMIVACGIGGIFLGLQRAGVISVLYILATVAGVAVTLYMLFHGGSVVSIAAGQLARSGLVAVGSVVYLLCWLGRGDALRLCWDGTVLRGMLAQSGWVFASRAAANIARRSDALIVAVLVGPVQAAVLAITQKAADIVRIFVDRAISACTPGLAHLMAQSSDTDRVRHRIDQILRVILWLALLGLGGYTLFNRDFIRLWLARDGAGSLFGGYGLTALIALAGLILTVNNLLYAVLFARGRVELTSRVAILEVLLRVPLTLLACRLWGIAGVVAAAVVSLVLTGLVIQGRVVCRLLDVSVPVLIRTVVRTVTRCLGPMVLFALATRWWPPAGAVGFVLLALGYLGVGLGTLLYAEPDLRAMAAGALGKLPGIKPLASGRRRVPAR